MSEKPKSTIVEKYHRAISALPEEEQMERAAKITSPKTLKRFLAEDAPEGLIYRFAARVQEVTGLSPYEEGTALLATCKSKNYQKATEKLETALKNGAKKADMGLSMAHGLLRNESKEMEYLEMAIEDRNDLEARLTAALRKLHMGIFNLELFREESMEILKICKQKLASKDRPPDETAMYVTGCVMVYHQNTVRAKEFLEPLAEKGSIDACQVLAELFLVQGKSPEKYIRLAIKFGYQAGYRKLGEYYAGIGEKDKAIKAYQMSLKAGHFERATNPLSALLIEKKDYEEAKKIAKQAVRAGDDIGGHIALSNIYEHEGKIDECIHHLEKALELGAINVIAGLVMIICDKGDYQKAAQICQKYLSKDPRIHILLAVIYLCSKDSKNHRKHMELGCKKSGHREEWTELMRLKNEGDSRGFMALAQEIMVSCLETMMVPQSAYESLIKNVAEKDRN